VLVGAVVDVVVVLLVVPDPVFLDPFGAVVVVVGVPVGVVVVVVVPNTPWAAAICCSMAAMSVWY
jgi:hypothetical protein